MGRQAVCPNDSGKKYKGGVTMTTKSITSGQEKQFKRFVEDAAERALKEVGLDKDGLQRLIEQGDELQARIITGIRDLSVSNQFADEEVESSYGYLSGYKPKGITEQTNILRQLFTPMRSSQSNRFQPTLKGGSPSQDGSRLPRPTRKRSRRCLT